MFFCKRPLVTVIIPTINEAESIGEVIDEIPNKKNKEILVIDSNSTDGTQEIARSKGAIVINEPRKGYGRAYKTGFAHAKGKYIVTLDGDTTYPAYLIDKLVEKLEKEKIDFITCDRITKLRPEVMSLKHRFGNWVLSRTMNILHHTDIKDSQSGMWVFRKDILPYLELRHDGMPFSEEIKIEAVRKGFKVAEIPIKYRARKGEVKLASWRDGTRNLLFLFQKALNPSSSSIYKRKKKTGNVQ